MARRKRLPLLLLAAAALLCGARVAHACSCAGQPTVLEAYEHAGVVVVARVVSVETPQPQQAAATAEEQAEKPAADEACGKGRAQDEKAAGGTEESDGAGVPGEGAGRGDFGSAKMIVERVYKGGLRVGEEMIFAHLGTSCDWSFDAADVGRRYLFYLGAPEKDQKFWSAGGCGRDSSLEHAADDLLYLNNLRKARGRTRLSGTVGFMSAEGMSVANRTIRVAGPKKTYEAKTDENGVYEIYDLPAGRYLVQAETPPGWKAKPSWVGRPPSFPGGDAEGRGAGKAAKGTPVVVQDKRHVGLDIHFYIDNAVRGRVFDAAGKPMRDVCLDLVPAVGKPPEHFYAADCTDEGGAFEIDEVPAGSYLLVVNDDGKVSSSEPFGTFYYPNVAERERAAVITVGPGDRLTGLDIHAPAAAETITIEGRFLYSDGKPVAEAHVEFEPEGDTGDAEGEARARTDAAGRFSIKILKGLRGKLYGSMFAYEGQFEKCPKLDALIRKAGASVGEVKTDGLALSAESDLRDVELRYGFPGCKKAKTPE